MRVSLAEHLLDGRAISHETPHVSPRVPPIHRVRSLSGDSAGHSLDINRLRLRPADDDDGSEIFAADSPSVRSLPLVSARYGIEPSDVNCRRQVQRLDDIQVADNERFATGFARDFQNG